MSEEMFREDSGGCILLKLRIHPGARRSTVNGIFNGALKIELQAPPVDGKANAALLKFLADKLDIPKSKISLKSGECSRDKVVKITDLTIEQIISKLEIVL